MKPKENHNQKKTELKGMDLCYTPPYALDPLLEAMNHSGAHKLNRTVFWEPAAGAGHLAKAMKARGMVTITSDLQDGKDYFNDEDVPDFDVSITNPPYSMKAQWLLRSYELGRPFALLLPVETIGSGFVQTLMSSFGCELLLLNRRVNFRMPNKGWTGSSAQFPVLWYCWQLLPQPINYGIIPKGAHKAFVKSLETPEGQTYL